ncbi:hypothetical protein ACFL21_01570, partial [Patescibacteria group bacterium]
MNIDKAYTDQMEQLSVPEDLGELIGGNFSREEQILVDRAKMASEIVAQIRQDIQDESDQIQQWIQAVMSGEKGEQIEACEAGFGSSIYRSDFYVNYYHQGEVHGDERNGLGLTTVMETDTNVAGGHTYPIRFELGWHNPEDPLLRGVYFREGYRANDPSFSAIREIDKHSRVQSGIWMSRVGGTLLSEDRVCESKEGRKFIGTVEADGIKIWSRGIEIRDGEVKPFEDRMRIAQFEHLFEHGEGHINSRNV